MRRHPLVYVSACSGDVDDDFSRRLRCPGSNARENVPEEVRQANNSQHHLLFPCVTNQLGELTNKITKTKNAEFQAILSLTQVMMITENKQEATWRREGEECSWSI